MFSRENISQFNFDSPIQITLLVKIYESFLEQRNYIDM